jgi:phosphomannomutase
MEEIFKAYDIRGIYPEELNEELAYRIGREAKTVFPEGPVGVSRDMRKAAPAIKESLIRGMREAGTDIVDLGLLSTCMHYFAVGRYGYRGGIQVTASHNPPEYIGMKFVGEEAVPIARENGLAKLAERVLSTSPAPPAEKPGRLAVEERTGEDYRERIRSLIGKLDPLQVVIDCSNGMAGVEVPPVFAGLPPRIELLNAAPDGNFPNHGPNPLLVENQAELVRRVKESGAAVGFIFDGDGDRTVVVDETGEVIPNDFVTALLAGWYLKRFPGSTIVADFRSSWAAEEYIVARSGVMIRDRVGHSFLKGRMRRTNAVFGGDIAGHYYFRDNYFSESSALTAARILELMTAEKKPLSRLWRPLKKYFSTGELNYPVADREAALAAVEKEFRADGLEPDHLDGVTFRGDDFWLNLRPSHTEPLVRFMAEAKTEDRLREIRARIHSILTRG